MPYIETPSARIYFEHWGRQGAFFTLVNGHTRTLADFRLLAEPFIAAGFQVLALDNRGSGRSESRVPFSMDDMAADLAGLWDAVGAKQSHLLGFSMGGAIAQIAASRWPERLLRLILVGTCADTKYIIADNSPWPSDLAGITRRLEELFAPQYVAAQGPLLEAMAKQTLRATSEGQFLARAAAQQRAIATTEIRNHALRVRAPTLIIHGKEDRAVAYASAFDLQQRIEGARCEILAGVGHLVHIEAPDRLISLVLEFLS